MVYKLAKELGIWNVEQYPDGLIYHMTDWQLIQWVSYMELEPFGEERADLRSAMTTAAVINSVRGIMAGWAGKSSYETVNPYDLLLFKDEERIERRRLANRTEEEIRAEKDAYFQSFKQTLVLSGKKGIEQPETCILIKANGEVIRPN